MSDQSKNTQKFVKASVADGTKILDGTKVSGTTESAKAWLDSVSPSMCLAKWLHTSLHLTNGRTHSCYHPPTHAIDVNEITHDPRALHNTQQKKRERRQMLSGERPAGCQYCWNIEDAPLAPPGGHRSDRHYRSGEHWSIPYREAVLSKPWDHNVDPTYVEVNFNQACNFRCSYCSPHLSSEWKKEIEAHGPYRTSTTHNDIEGLRRADLMPPGGPNSENPYVQAFWKWWPELYKNLLVFRMTGGEPLMDQNTFRVLEYVAQHPKGDLGISITSNMCPPDQKLIDRLIESLKRIQDYSFEVFVLAKHDAAQPDHEKWPRFVVDRGAYLEDSLLRFDLAHLPSVTRNEVERFYDFASRKKTDASEPSYVYSLSDTKACNHFSLYVSLDAWQQRAEYIRHGMKFETLLTNVKRVLYETHFTTISFINTFNLLSVSSLREFLQGILELRRFVNGLQHVEGKNAPFNNFWSRQRVWFDVPLLRAPAWQSVQNLPLHFQDYLRDAIRFMEENTVEKHGPLIGFSDYEVDKVRRNLGWMSLGEKLPGTELEKRRRDFYAFFAEHDRRRGTSLPDVFPELNDYWLTCKDKYLRG